MRIFINFFIALSILIFSKASAQTTTYLWSNGATTPSISVTPSVTTTYYVTITQDGINYYDSLVVTVDANPTSPTVTTTTATCSSAGIATISNYNATQTYTFTPAGPTVGTGGVISGLTPGTSYTVTTTNTSNCTSTASTSFSVAAKLVANTASAASASPTLCANTTMTSITHSTTGATGIGTPTGLPSGVSASWALNTITISGTPTASGTFNYSIPLTGGCGTVNATGTITVTAPTTPTFTQVGPYLSGASIPALPTTSTNGISGTWSPAISNTTTTTYTFTPSAGQCGTTTTMTITINQPLQYTLTANDSTVCAGTTVTLSVNLQQPAATLEVGNLYQGGKIAYILKSGDPGYDPTRTKGLIVTTSDQGTAIWGCYGTELQGADENAIGAGLQNTLDIINGCSTANIAAKICNDLVVDQYDDWFLPSANELKILYINRTTIGGFQNVFYWSSTEGTQTMAGYAKCINFADGLTYGNRDKGTLYNVRAIRYFSVP